MKHALLSIVSIFIFGVSASAQNAVFVSVTNNLPIERQNETVVLDWKQLIKLNRNLKPDFLKISDSASGNALAPQTVDADGDGTPGKLIFQVSFGAGEKAKNIRIEATKEKQPQPETKTFGRFVPERMDDFAWENDRVAFRTYGKTLEKELVSSGIDVWAKRVGFPIIDRWYRGGDLSYHKDNGTGLDFYSVKKSRGCGGSGIWDGKNLHVSRNFVSSKVLANGPIRTQFELKYEPWNAGGATISEIKRITIDAGQNFYLVESFYQTSGDSRGVDVGVGIADHEPEYETEFDRGANWMSLWETNKKNGSLGCAVVAEPQTFKSFQEIPVGNFDYPHRLLIIAAKPDKTARYYVGAGWSRAGFADKKAWIETIENFSRRAASPPVVRVSGRKGN